ncbi:MAG: protein-tyrosine-phosphatase [Variibacter sp.]|nr:protein-tyrosine-phosphatase [Variibacter sp.]
MQPLSLSLLTICGLEELTHHGSRGVTHVLSILDPDHSEADWFRSYHPHRRVTLRFHDVIEPTPGQMLPGPEHVAAILDFGRDLASSAQERETGHLLVHCHAGISRSTAAMAILMAQTFPDLDEDRLFADLVAIRTKAWPNSRMIAFADEALGRGGRLSAAAGRLYGRQLQVFPHIETFMRQNGRTREIEMARGETPAGAT